MTLRPFVTLALATALTALTGCPAAGDGATSAATAAAPSASAASTVSAAPATTGMAARVNGKDISYADLDKAAASNLVRIRTQEYEIRKTALDTLIDEQLMEAEATTRGITTDELVKVEVTDKAQEPSDEEAKAYFDANPPRGQVDFEKLKPRVKAFMKRQAEQEARTAFIEGLREKAGVEVFLQPLRFDVPLDGTDPIWGDANAPVTIVEFSDFQCPYCSRVNPTIEQIKKEYAGKVSLTFRDYPLPMHAEAPKASEASHCAHEQGKFWEYHDLLFANQKALKTENLKSYAAQLGLDGDAFATCLDSGKWAKDVAEDMADGQAVGVSGTPAFFINGQFLNGARPFEQFKELIDGELKAKGLL